MAIVVRLVFMPDPQVAIDAPARPESDAPVLPNVCPALDAREWASRAKVAAIKG